MDEIRVADLFGGIGGFRKGLQEASDKYKFVWYCDIDKYAVSVYNKNYGECYEPTDITKIKPEEIPDFDMLCGGFPCQAFSIAGHRRGFKDTRGTLFFEIARIIKAKKPKIVFLENVKGLLNHKQGETFKVILQTLDELGYRVEWMVLNSKFFGVPQNRERVFIIGYLRGGSRQQVLPFREDARKIQEVSKGKTYKAHRANEIREHEGSPTLTQNMGTGGHNVPIVMNTQKRGLDRPCMVKAREEGKSYPGGYGTIGKEDEAYCLDVGMNQGVARSVKTPDRKPRQEGRWVKEPDEATFTLNNQDRDGVIISKTVRSGGRSSVDRHSWDICNQYDKLRRLTPVECERLQGFPDDWTKYGTPIMNFKGRCVKQTVVAIIENNGKYWFGYNECLTPQQKCPRIGFKTGTGYELCKEICGQVEHAEVSACKKAGKNAKGGTLHLIGHYYCCEHCKKIMKDYGIKKTVIGNLPDILISDTQRYRQLGNAVTVNVIKAIGEKLCVNL